MAFSTDKSEYMVTGSKSHVQTAEHIYLCPPSQGIQTTQKNLGKSRLRKRCFAESSPWRQLPVVRVESGHPLQARPLLWDSLTSERSSMPSLRPVPGHYSRQAQEQAVPEPQPSKSDSYPSPLTTPDPLDPRVKEASFRKRSTAL